MPTRLLLVLLAALLTSGCTTVQHCVDGQGDDLTTCFEVNGLGGAGLEGVAASNLITGLCAALGNEPAPGPCPDEGKVGGCFDAGDGEISQTEWTYTGTLAEIECSSSEDVKVDADGEPIGGAGDDDDDDAFDLGCSPQGGTAITVAFDNGVGEEISLYWVDFDCAEQLYATLPVGGSHSQGTFVGHVWRARAGTDPAGNLLWAAVVEAGDDAAPIVIQ